MIRRTPQGGLEAVEAAIVQIDKALTARTKVTALKVEKGRLQKYETSSHIQARSASWGSPHAAQGSQARFCRSRRL